MKSFGDLADVYTGRAATMATFTREIVPKINSYDKIIFATHGYFGNELEPEILEPILLMSMTPSASGQPPEDEYGDESGYQCGPGGIGRMPNRFGKAYFGRGYDGDGKSVSVRRGAFGAHEPVER